MLALIDSKAIAINWMTWWVGDTLGVLVALPLMLVLAGEPRTLWRVRLWYVAIPMIVCFALLVAGFVRVKSWEEAQSLTKGWESWSVLAGGTLLTGLLGSLLMLGTGSAYRIRAKEQELEDIINRTPFMLTRCSRDFRYRLSLTERLSC
jgi:hypothetical protein